MSVEKVRQFRLTHPREDIQSCVLNAHPLLGGRGTSRLWRLTLFGRCFLFLPAKERHNPNEGFHLYSDYLHYDGYAHYLDNYSVAHHLHQHSIPPAHIYFPICDILRRACSASSKIFRGHG